MYSYKSRVRFSECDKNLELSIPGLVNYFQDTSTFHSEDLGVGLNYLAEIGCAWILSYWHIEIHQMPKLGDEVELITWPYEMKGFMASRNFVMKSQSGEILANANTLWVYMDMVKNKIKKVDDHQIELYKTYEAFDMPKTSRKVAIPEELTKEACIKVENHHIDSNNHVNNEKYISLAASLIETKEPIRSIRTEYKQSALLGDTIFPGVASKGNEHTVVLGSKGKNPYAVVEFITK